MAAPYNKSIIVSVFVRKAQTQANPADFLLNLLLGNFDAVTQGDAVVQVSFNTGGSSGSWQLPPGMSRMDIIEIAELALRNIETGIDTPLAFDEYGNSMPAPIKQVAPSKRLISFAQFSNVQH